MLNKKKSLKKIVNAKWSFAHFWGYFFLQNDRLTILEYRSPLQNDRSPNFWKILPCKMIVSPRKVSSLCSRYIIEGTVPLLTYVSVGTISNLCVLCISKGCLDLWKLQCTKILTMSTSESQRCSWSTASLTIWGMASVCASSRRRLWNVLAPQHRTLHHFPPGCNWKPPAEVRVKNLSHLLMSTLE